MQARNSTKRMPIGHIPNSVVCQVFKLGFNLHTHTKLMKTERRNSEIGNVHNRKYITFHEIIISS